MSDLPNPDNEPTLAPRYRNPKHFTEEEFPHIAGFCDVVPESLVEKPDKVSYEYHLNGKIAYRIFKTANDWKVEEFHEGKLLATSNGPTLGGTLYHALTRPSEELPGRVKILFPVYRKDKNRAICIMYNLGGYPGSWFPTTPELNLILDKFIHPKITFLAFSKVPIQYTKWLSEVLLGMGITGQTPNRIVWRYR